MKRYALVKNIYGDYVIIDRTARCRTLLFKYIREVLTSPVKYKVLPKGFSGLICDGERPSTVMFILESDTPFSTKSHPELLL